MAGPRDILLVRHGLAGESDPRLYPDDDLRPLTPKGNKAFRRAAQGLLRLGVRPAVVFSSPALRALQTARLLAAALGLRARDVKTLDLLHHSVAPAAALKALAKRRLPVRFALVGHEPWLGEFASLLVAGSARARLPLKKGGACRIEAGALEPRGGALAWSLTQDQLGLVSRA